MRGLIEQRVEPAALLANSDDVGVLERYQCALSKVRSVDQRMRLGMRVSAFASCGRAVAHVRGSSGPILLQKSGVKGVWAFRNAI